MTWNYVLIDSSIASLKCWVIVKIVSIVTIVKLSLLPCPPCAYAGAFATAKAIANAVSTSVSFSDSGSSRCWVLGAGCWEIREV